MPAGTAFARLRKMLLFNLLQKYAEDACFRCGEKIERIEDLSIEHKKPWEGISVELFWDLDNIAFSHLRCNLPHSYRGGGPRLRKIGPEGTTWCSRCQEFLPIANFSRNKSNWSGFQLWRNSCRKEYNPKPKN